jgi:HPt (histidine-containing phosphotransfer) domain-containing protein
MKNNKTDHVVDLSYLKKVSNGDDSFIKEMIKVYLKETPEALKNLETHLENKDWKKFRAVTHKMKPSFSFFGLTTVYDVVNSMEEYSDKETHLTELPEMLEKVKGICCQAISELQQLQV